MRACIIFSVAILSTNSIAACPDTPPFKDGISGSAAQYTSSGNFSLNNDGILVRDYGKTYGGLGKWPNPFFISRYANGLYSDWYKGGCIDGSLKDAFLKQARWFVENYEDRNGLAAWTYPFDNHHYGVDAGWISGIGQSHIAGVLLRAFGLTGQVKFKEVSKAAMEAYLRPVTEGGVVVYGDGGAWVQEVPNSDGRAFNVLNGHITGILGVLDVAQVTGDKQLYDLVDEGIEAVRSQLPMFDAGFTSFYELRGVAGESVKLAPRGGYNNLHVRQLMRLYEISGNLTFKEMADLFRTYEVAVYNRNAKGSSKVSTHGPEQAEGRVKNTYWSHNKFPTWYEIEVPKGSKLDGVYLKSLNQKSAAKDFSVSVQDVGGWRVVWSSSNNAKQEVYAEFERSTVANRIRIDILSDNGSNNVSFDIAMPVISKSKPLVRLPLTIQ